MTPERAERLIPAITLYSLTEDSLVEFGEAGAVTVVTRWGEHEFPRVAEPVRESLRRMTLGPVPLVNVVAAGSAAWMELLHTLGELTGAVVHSLGTPDGRSVLMSVVPVADVPALLSGRRPRDRRIRLSRLAVLRPSDGRMLLDSAGARYQALLAHPAVVSIATSLSAAHTVDSLAATTRLPLELVTDVVGLLIAAGLVLVGDDEARFREDDDPGLALWDRDGLMFHRRSRTWPVGHDPEADAPGEPAPVVKAGVTGPVVALPRPEPPAGTPAGPTLSALLESDHHGPVFSDRPIPVERLGALLFRAARVRSIGESRLPASRHRIVTQRPYYSVGLVYELEIYLWVHRCTGLDRGIYHYDPVRHAATLINRDPDDLAAVLDMAMVAGGGQRWPSALLTVSARMSRVGRTSGGAGYATTLLHLGALQQVLYLTGKTVGLAAYSLPLDAGDRVDRALMLEWPDEVAIGEITLDAR